MGAVEDVVNKIKQEILECETDEMGGIQFIRGIEFGDWLMHVPDIEVFLHPEPDVEKEVDHPEDKRVLGSYRPMQSPGLITLHSRHIKDFFWGLIKRVSMQPYGAFITKPDLERVALLVTKKTWHHEVFHFNCDVLRMLFGGDFDPLSEEALAVAYSRRQISGERMNANSTIGRISAPLYNTAMNYAYRYASPGYRDWHLYADDTRFKIGLLDYIKPGHYEKLRSNGVGAEELLHELLGKANGFVERVV